MGVAFSVIYWLFLGATAIVLFLGALAIWLATAPFDPCRTVLHRYTCWWAQLYLRCLPGCRIRVEGRDRIAPGTPYVLVANHQSMADIMALSALAVPFKWVSKKEVFRLPCIGWNMYLNQYIRVDRGNVHSVHATMDECRHWLHRGMPLLMFPEGTRSRTGAIKEFHGGSFKLAVESGCAVIPIVVDGTLPIFQGLRVQAFPGTITIRVLVPIRVEEACGSADKLRDLVHQRMNAELSAIRACVEPA